MLLLIGAFFAARILFILFIPFTNSTDLNSWLHVMNVLEAGGNPYRETEVLNWPPFWMQILFGIRQLSSYTGLSPITGIQGVLIACEALILCIAYFIGQRFFEGKNVFKALLFGIAINPVCIFLSCMHCNYDVFVGLWVLLAAWMLIEYSLNKSPDTWLMACFFIGMGILTKTVPAILVPLLLIGIRGLPHRTKIFGALLLAAPFAIGMSVLFSLEPRGVMHNVISYRSMGGWYGFTGIIWTLGAGTLLPAYKILSPFLFLAVMLFAAWKCYRTAALKPAQVLMSVLLLLLFVPTFGPGYAPPYILWFLPVAVLVFVSANPPLQKLLTACWIICILTYVVEYAVLGDHGAFLPGLLSEELGQKLPPDIGSRPMQTLTRLPIFVSYIMLFFALIKSLRQPVDNIMTTTVHRS